jgi:DNA-binding GntR family transcriptional regulator
MNRTTPVRPRKGDTETDEAVYAALLNAILEGRLEAGAKLAEVPLAHAFGVSRERIRKVLHRLVAERRLEAITNRGVYVPQPTLQDVRAIYQAHRVLEAGVILELAARLDDRLIDALEAHIGREQKAAMERDRAASVRLSGEFHILLADSLGNLQVSAFLRDLLMRSSLMVSVYENTPDSICGVNEHAAIVEALQRRDVAAAMRFSADHFRHVEARLRLKRPETEKVGVAELFAPIGRTAARA